MTFKKIGSKFLIRLEKDQEITTELTNFCQDQNINFGTISAIGGATHVTLGWYQLSDEQNSSTSKSYHWQDFSGNLEVVSLTGNVSLLDGKPFLHIHCVVSNESFQCFGGHLKSGLVAATLEAIIEPSDVKIERQMDSNTALNLLKLDSD